MIDLSADFRLRDPALYEQHYGLPHRAIQLQADAVYGLTELARDAIRATDLVANPGPLSDHRPAAAAAAARGRLIDADPIVIDAKSGVSGAGRDAKQATLYTEVSRGPARVRRRHAPAHAGDRAGPVRAPGSRSLVTFTPHLVPMNRGILATIYVKLAPGAQPAICRRRSSARYADEPFVRVLPYQSLPATRHVRGTNLCLIAVHPGPAARPRDPARGHRQSGQGRVRPGAAEHERDARPATETTGLEPAPLFP